MVVIRRKENCLWIEESRYYCIYDCACFSGSRRPLNVCHRIIHRIVNGKELVKIDILINNGNRKDFIIWFHGTKLTKKCLNRNWHLIFSVHFCNCFIFFIKIYIYVSLNTKKIRPVINGKIFPLPYILSNCVFYHFCIPFKIIKKKKIVIIKKILNAEFWFLLLRIIHTKFRTGFYFISCD